MLPHYRIVEVTDGREAIAGQILADLGADVVLVEPPQGAALRRAGSLAAADGRGGSSMAFCATNRGKRSVCLDMNSQSGREGFRQLLSGADALIVSHPSRIADSGSGLDRLAELHPELVIVAIAPFGTRGPKADWPATDFTVTAASGATYVTGDEDRAPLASSIPQAFLNAGAEAAVGTLIALRARDRDGLGQIIDVSAQTAMMMTTQSFILSAGWSASKIQRFGGGYRLNDARVSFVYPCKDGYVNIALMFGDAIGPATARLFEWMCEEGFIDAATRDKDWVAFGTHLLTGEAPASEMDRCSGAITNFTRSHTKDELFEEAQRRGVLLVPVSDMSDLVKSRQLESRDFWRILPHPESGKNVTYPGPFVRFSETPIRYDRPPPLPGEHSSEVLGQRRTREPSTESAAPENSPAPLSGLRVLDFTWVYAGPAATRYLSDYGATVLKVESPHRPDLVRQAPPHKEDQPGMESSANYANANVGKLGLTLDLSIEKGREMALRLVEWADVVVENFSPKVMKAWGLDYESLRRRKPDLIMASSCLNGQSGPQASLAGYGMMGAALCGFGYLTGWPDRQPAGPFVAYTDYTSPKIVAASVLAALEHRRQTGKGQYIDCSQAESSIHFLAEAVLDYSATGRIASARGNESPDYAPNGAFPCRGADRWIALSAPDDRTWNALCGLADRGWQSEPGYRSGSSRITHRKALEARISDWTREQDVGELEQALVDAGIPAHRVSTSKDIFEDPQLAAREHLVVLEHPTLGPITVESSRMRFSRTPATASRPAPTLGQDNERMLSEFLALNDEERIEVLMSGAIG